MGQKNLLTRIDAEKRKELIDNVNYHCDLSIAEHDDEYHATVTIDFTLKMTDSDTIIIDFITKKIHSLLINNKKNNNFILNDCSLEIAIDEFKEGKNSLTIAYTNDFDHTGSGFHKFIDPQDNAEYMHTDFQPFDAHRLFPCFDQPDIKATYQLQVTGPPCWVYIHNTPIENEEIDLEKNIKTLTFKRSAKFSTYLFALVIGPYEEWHDNYHTIPLGIYCRKSLAQHMDQENIFAITKESMAFLEEYFDFPYPYHKYDQVFVPEFNFGAMENVGCVTFSERYIFRHTMLYDDHLNRANTISHEMVHMWFGDLVTMKWWDDLWLNESFADYLSYYTLQHGTLFPDAMEHFYSRKEWAYNEDQLSTTHPIAATAIDTDEAFSNFDGISYSKGASVLRQLQYYIGEETFQKAMQHYFKRFAEDNTVLQDFLDLMSEMSGIDIINWSKQWLETTGVNTLEPGITDGILHINQIPSDNNNIRREHAIEFTAFTLNEGTLSPSESRKVFIGKDPSTEINLNNKECCFVILNTHDHDYVKIHFSKEDLHHIKEYLHTLKNNFFRRQIWGNLWQMVRDNKISPLYFLSLASDKGPLEKDNSILQSSIISKIFPITDFYLTDQNRKLEMPKLYALAHENLKNSANNEERQIIWFNLLLHASESMESFEFLKGLLGTEKTVTNLTIDQDKRWAIIAHLMAYNDRDAEFLLTQERERDKTDLGLKQAFLVETSRPNAELKEKFWKQCIENRDLSTDYMRYGMQGFNWHCQKHMLAQFEAQYYDNIINVFQTKDIHYATAFGRLLYPIFTLSREAERKLENFISKKRQIPLPLLLDKVLKGRRDVLVRILPILEKQ